MFLSGTAVSQVLASLSPMGGGVFFFPPPLSVVLLSSLHLWGGYLQTDEQYITLHCFIGLYLFIFLFLIFYFSTALGAGVVKMNVDTDTALGGDQELLSGQ